MSDHDALLGAICANPDEDTPRLMYADWLDEHGQGKRAAFVRADVERHRCATADTGAAALGALLEERGAFLDRYGRTLAGPVDWSLLDAELDRFHKVTLAAAGRGGKPTPKSEKLPAAKGFKIGTVERGFHSSVTVTDADAFLTSAGAIFRAAPVAAVQFNRLSAEQAKSFAAAGYLARVRHLGFGQIEPEAIRVLGAHPDAAGVRSLASDLRAGGGARLEALGAGRHWTAITRMKFSGDDYEDEFNPGRAVAALLRLPQFRRIRHLRAENISRDADAACRAIAGLTELRSLHLDQNSLWESGTGALARSSKLKNLRYLYLEALSLDDRGASASELLTTSKLPNLVALHLEVFEGLNAKVLEKAAAGPPLRVLSMRHKLSGPVLTALARCPSLQGLWYLELDCCHVTDTGIMALIKRAQFRQLAVLKVSGWTLGERAVKALARYPVLASLQDLRLATKAVGPAGAKALIASPYLQGIKHLSVDGGRAVSLLQKHFGKGVVW